MNILETPRTVFTDFHLFCGSGGGAFGFQQARHEYKGVTGVFRTLGGIDCDPLCIEDFEHLTGVKGTCMDLFDKGQYTDFHGHAPGPEWREMQPEDIRKASRGECPDVVFLSPPCKGFSGLLPAASSASPKYQALNRLVVRSMDLVVRAYADNLPAAILIENVPRITSRGAKLLEQVEDLLGRHGYVFHRGTHDCGEIGGLGQTRKRFLLIARNPTKLPSFIYQPVKYRLKSIGDILGIVPTPGDITRCGAMHRLPNLAWRTWERLALIPAGKDWRALNDLQHNPRDGAWRIVPWDEPAPTVTGSTGAGRSNGVSGVADPRLPEREQRFSGLYRVVDWYEPAPTVIGQTDIQCGALSVSDPRVQAFGGRPGLYGVCDWDKPAPTISSRMKATSSNTPAAVADPRTQTYNNILRVMDWQEPAGAIVAASGGNVGPYAADPRLGCEPRSGTMMVQEWSEPAKTVTASGDIHAAAAAVADPRIPPAGERGVYVIISKDGAWHRPLTTFEMAMLQSLPSTFPDGSPLVLAGRSDAVWREHIGNMVPPAAGCAMATAMLMTLMPNSVGEPYWDIDGRDLWVIPTWQDGIPARM